MHKIKHCTTPLHILQSLILVNSRNQAYFPHVQKTRVSTICTTPPPMAPRSLVKAIITIITHKITIINIINYHEPITISQSDSVFIITPYGSKNVLRSPLGPLNHTPVILPKEVLGSAGTKYKDTNMMIDHRYSITYISSIIISINHWTAGRWFGTCVFPYIGISNPNWLMFFRRVETTNQTSISLPLFTQKNPPQEKLRFGSTEVGLQTRKNEDFIGLRAKQWMGKPSWWVHNSKNYGLWYLELYNS